jgi:hypothetical protein
MIIYKVRYSEANLLPRLSLAHIEFFDLRCIRQDLITDDEIISDSYNLKEVDGVVYEADCALIKIGGESFDTGANASAEGGDDEGIDDNVETKIDVVHSFRLQSTGFDKKGYLTYLKGYMKAVKEKLKEKGASDDEIKAFETGA